MVDPFNHVLTWSGDTFATWTLLCLPSPSPTLGSPMDPISDLKDCWEGHTSCWLAPAWSLSSKFSSTPYQVTPYNSQPDPEPSPILPTSQQTLPFLWEVIKVTNCNSHIFSPLLLPKVHFPFSFKGQILHLWFDDTPSSLLWGNVPPYFPSFLRTFNISLLSSSQKFNLETWSHL